MIPEKHRAQIFVRMILSIVFLFHGAFLFYGCKANQNGEEKIAEKSFTSIGSFSVEKIAEGWTEVKDGAGRIFVLIPRGQTVPDGYQAHQVIRVPVKRVVAYGYFDVAIMKALGVINTLVGVTAEPEDWVVPEVIEGLEKGHIRFMGGYNAIDFERLKEQAPEMILTWDASIIPMAMEMNIPAVITSTPVAMCLSARMRFVKFIAPFFEKEKEADAYFKKIAASLEDIRKQIKHVKETPKVIWGDIYEKRVLVEPGNAWVGELIGLVESDYLFDDIWGKSCIEISLERFLYSGKEADIFFTYKTPKMGATSKDALKKGNAIVAAIRPLKEGKVYAPLANYAQAGDKLDEILTEIAAILHPDIYKNHVYTYFRELPEHDPPEVML